MSGGVTGTHAANEQGWVSDSNAQDQLLLSHSAAITAEITNRNAAIDARTLTDVVAVSAAGTLALNKLTQVSAGSALTMTLPTGSPRGSVIVVEKADSSTNVVTVSGTIRGSAAVINLSLTRESVMLVSDSTGSWNPAASHKTLASLQSVFAAINASIFNVRSYGAGAAGNTAAQDTAAFDAAASAMVAQGYGTLYIPAGTYTVNHLPNFTPFVTTGAMTYAVVGDGSAVTVVNNRGTNAAASLTVSNPAFDVDNASYGAPLWRGFTLDGTGSSGGCSGIRWGDVSYGQFQDIAIRNFASGDGMMFPNGYGWTEGIQIQGVNLTNNGVQLHYDVGSGAPIGTISASVASGTTVTSLAVTATTRSLYSGQSIVLAATTSAPGVAVQTVTTSASVAQGATSIPITSTTLNFAITSGTSQVSKGSYGSFDYWTIDSMYLAAGPNQHGVVSEVPRGLGGNIDRTGTTFRATGNFGKGSSNTGNLFWIKGNDNWSNINWDFSCEIDGTGVAHTSVRQDTTASYLGGFGKFICYFFGPVVGQSYQFGVYGRVCLNGYTDTNGSNIMTVTAPFSRSIKGGVAPSSVPTGLTAYPVTAPTSGSSYQNLSGVDVFVTITFVATATANAGWNVDNYSSLPVGADVFAGIPSGQTFSITFVHYHNSYAKVTFSGCTASAPKIRYI